MLLCKGPGRAALQQVRCCVAKPEKETSSSSSSSSSKASPSSDHTDTSAKVFDLAAKDRYEVVSAEDFANHGKHIIQTEKKWRTEETEVMRHFAQDTLWMDWERIEMEKDDFEILDLPHFASGLTIFLRYQVVKMRTRSDKFFTISDLLESHYTKRRTMYRNAYQTMRHTARVDDTRYPKFFSVPSAQALKGVQFQSYSGFIHSRHKRDVLTLFTEDSFVRSARKRNFSKQREITAEFWKHDFHYQTKWEGRIKGAREVVRFLFFIVKVPTVFFVGRGVLMALEHTSLLFDYLQVYAKGGRSVHAATLRGHNVSPTRPDGMPMNKGEESLRERIADTRTASPAASMLLWTGFFAIIAHFYIWIGEGRLPFYFVPYHERENYLDLLRAFEGESNNKKKFGWFERAPAPVVPEQPRANFDGMSNL